MGNQHTKPVSTFSDWQKVQTQNQIDIYRNKKSNELAQKRSVTIDPHFDLDDQMKIYHMRLNNNDSLVRAFGAQQVHKKGHGQGICSGHKKLQVLTQRMPYRLNELPQLTFPQSLLFLRQSLRAYYRVFKSYGPIHVTKKLIGINEFGQVKSWVNQNWALNHPNNDLPTLQSTKLQSFSGRSTEAGSGSQAFDAKYRDQTEMVYNIVAVVEEKCEQGKFPKAFSEQVQQHSSSFRKLSTYLEDFIRINELFIPPKINYETVFVSKYQTRLVEQQSQQTGQQIANQAQTVQNQGISKMENVQSLGYATTTIGGYQQQSSTAQNLGYGANVIQGQEGGQNGYTTTKITTTTCGNTINPVTTTSPVTFTSAYQAPTYQPASYQASTYQPYQAQSSSFLTSTNNNLSASIPWQKTESIYKLPQPSQSTYSSSYYQYSVTNPSSVGVGSYKLGGTSTGGEYSGETFKPLSYNSALGNSSGLQVNGATQNYITPVNQNTYTFTSLDNRFGNSQNDNPLSPYQNLAQFTNDRKTQFQTYTSITPTKQSYQEFKKNFGQIGQATTTNLPTYGYSTTTYETKNIYQPLGSDSAQKGSNFSFDGRSNLTTKFNDYAGKGYSNNLVTYEKTTNNLTQVNADGSVVEGKYAPDLNNLLGPMLKMRNQYQAQNSTQNYANNQGLTVHQNYLQHA